MTVQADLFKAGAMVATTGLTDARVGVVFVIEERVLVLESFDQHTFANFLLIPQKLQVISFAG